MLKERLQNDIKEALREKNAQKRIVLGMVLNSVKNRELDKRAKFSKEEGGVKDEQFSLNDEEVVEVISSEIKKRKEAVGQYEKGGRPELAQKEKDEIIILADYMPEQMSEEEIRKIVEDTIKDMALPPRALAKTGQVIGTVMAKIKGKADGTLVSKIVKEELSK